jgi:hypothetical protein
MSIPAFPSNYYAQQGNGQVLLSWDLVAGATTYNVQRSTDGVTYASVSTPATNKYLDTSVTIGTQYWYKVASTNSSGTSAYTTAQSVVPVTSGEMCLSQIRLAAQQRADRVNSNYVTLPEWNVMINQSLFELYDLLVTVYDDYFVATPAQFTTGQSSNLYALPDGVTSFTNGITGAAGYIAPPFYKLIGVDLALNTANNAWVTVDKFNFSDRNKFLYPNTSSTIYGVFNLAYRLVGTNIEFIPTPSSNQSIRLWYIPRLTMLLQDTDTTTSGVSGWIEYVITDAAIKALQKEESDVSVLLAQKAALIKRIEESAMNRDAGRPDTISDVRSGNAWNGGSSGGWNSPMGGF